MQNQQRHGCSHFAYENATKPATIAANKKDKATAGPACSAATTPGSENGC